MLGSQSVGLAAADERERARFIRLLLLSAAGGARLGARKGPTDASSVRRARPDSRLRAGIAMAHLTQRASRLGRSVAVHPAGGGRRSSRAASFAPCQRLHGMRGAAGAAVPRAHAGAALIDQQSGLGDIARHLEAGLDCRICERGAGAYRPVSKTVDGRKVVRGFESLSLRSQAGIPRSSWDSGRSVGRRASRPRGSTYARRTHRLKGFVPPTFPRRQRRMILPNIGATSRPRAARPPHMPAVAGCRLRQRAPACHAGGRGFESRRSRSAGSRNLPQ
jgi:hypothetical protein